MRKVWCNGTGGANMGLVERRSAESAEIRHSARPLVRAPGRCQICGAFAVVGQVWPETLPARFVELCEDCRVLGDEEIARRVDPNWRQDGAVV